MIDEIQTVHVTTEGDTPTPQRSGDGDQRWDIISWIIVLLGPRTGGGWGS